MLNTILQNSDQPKSVLVRTELGANGRCDHYFQRAIVTASIAMDMTAKKFAQSGRL